jgi:protein Mpv17
MAASIAAQGLPLWRSFVTTWKPRIAGSWKKHAFWLGSGLTGAKTCIADILVQKQYEGRSEIDWRRNFVFTSFGFFYLGAFQYVQYTLWFPRFFPGNAGLDVAKKVAFDQIINTGMWYYPLFYMVQSCVMSATVSADKLGEGIERYKTNVTTDMVNCWKLWVPAQIVNFSLVPVHMRVPFAAGVSFVWSCVLSALRGDIQRDPSKPVGSTKKA